MSALLITAALLIVGMLLFTGTMAFVSRWLRYPKPGFGRSLLVVLIWFALALVAFCLTMKLGDPPVTPIKSQLSLAVGLLTLALEVAAIYVVQKPSLAKALAGWGLVMIVRLVMLAFAIFVVREHVVGSYISPTTAMAPTLLCQHAIGTCPRCGGPLVFSMDDEYLRNLQRVSGPQIAQIEGYCMNCRQPTSAPFASLVPLPADRFFVTKFLSPRRWDLVAYRFKGVTFLKRLIAFPGETIAIDAEGKISLNGQSLVPPPDAPAQFRWFDQLDVLNAPQYANALKPNVSLHLGPDDYFALGDFAERSSDSRLNGPVHKADIVGVATFIYWPITRARILR